jgi:hypothetical protein
MLLVFVVAGFVLDANGPVANAEVRVVELAPMACPCTPVDEPIGFGNEVPECHCPAALAMWQQRLAKCTWPTPAIQVARTDKLGRVALDPRVLGHAIEAWTPTAVRWLDVPKRADRVGIELAEQVRHRLIVDTRADIAAALMFDDGHCMPFRRDGGTAWVTAAPVFLRTDEAPTLVIEAKGFATVVRSWYESTDAPLQLTLAKAQSIHGSCAGDRVKLDNPFQQVVAPVARGKFRVDDIVDIETTVTCMRGNKAKGEWLYTYSDGLQESGGLIGGLFGDDCTNVDVVDRAARPIANASVDFFHIQSRGANWSMGSGTSSITDAHGRACVQDAFAGGEITVHPPADRGGQCAGEVKLKVTDKLLAKPIKVVLDTQPLMRARWRGRLLTADKLPVVGASITISDLEPSEVASCSTSSDLTVESGVDGTFELPLVPQGKAKLVIAHGWYTQLELDVKIPGPERELVLDRGTTWTGRVVDAQGKVIDRCYMTLHLPDQRSLSGQCSATGFTFRTLVPGDARLEITRMDTPRDATADERQLKRVIKIGTGRTLAQDVAWPATSRAHLIDAP